MFDFSFAELALIVVVTVIFIGPKELPVVVKAIAKAMHGFRSITKEIRGAFDDLSRESGLKDAADALHNEMRMIKGDDGQMYESFTIPKPGEAMTVQPPAPSTPPHD